MPVGRGYGLFAVSVGSEPVTILAKFCLTDWLQNLQDTLLYQPVPDTGNAGEIAKVQNSLRKVKSRERGLYEDYKDGIITSEEYLQYQKSYRKQAAELEKSAEEMLESQQCYKKDFLLDEEWDAAVKKFIGKRKLTKEMADAFVERIVLDKEGNVEITLKYDDFLKELLQTEGEKA